MGWIWTLQARGHSSSRFHELMSNTKEQRALARQGSGVCSVISRVPTQEAKYTALRSINLMSALLAFGFDRHSEEEHLLTRSISKTGEGGPGGIQKVIKKNRGLSLCSYFERRNL